MPEESLNRRPRVELHVLAEETESARLPSRNRERPVQSERAFKPPAVTANLGREHKQKAIDRGRDVLGARRKRHLGEACGKRSRRSFERFASTPAASAANPAVSRTSRAAPGCASRSVTTDTASSSSDKNQTSTLPLATLTSVAGQRTPVKRGIQRASVVEGAAAAPVSDALSNRSFPRAQPVDGGDDRAEPIAGLLVSRRTTSYVRPDRPSCAFSSSSARCPSSGARRNGRPWSRRSSRTPRWHERRTCSCTSPCAAE